MRDPKSVPGAAGGEGHGAGTQKSRGLDVRFASGADATVGRRLKEMYDGLVSEPVPDRFLDLLGQLERAEKPTAVGTGTAAGGEPASDLGDGDAIPGAKP
jgi:hypothetical protein